MLFFSYGEFEIYTTSMINDNNPQPIKLCSATNK